MDDRIKKWVILILKAFFSVYIIIFVIKAVNSDLLLKNIIDIQIDWVIMSFILFTFSKALTAFRLQRIFKINDIHITQLQNLKLYLYGMFYNMFLPGGITGDLYKIIALNKARAISRKKILKTLLYDRLLGLVAITILALILITFIMPGVFTFTLLGTGLIGTALSGVLLTRILSLKNADYPILTFYSVASQFTQIICFYIILAAVSVDIDEMIYGVVFLCSSVAAMLPISIGGLGAREFVIYYLSNSFHLDIAGAVSSSLIFYIISLLLSLTGAYYMISNRSINLSE